MRRLLRRLFNVAATASAALCAAVVVLWVRSQRAGGEHVSRLVREDRYTLRSEAGRVAMFRPTAASPGGGGPAGTGGTQGVAGRQDCGHSTPGPPHDETAG